MDKVMKSFVSKTVRKYKVGYNKRLDQSLGNRRGSKRVVRGTYAQRRAGSRNLEKYWLNRRAFNVNTMAWKRRQLAKRKATGAKAKARVRRARNQPRDARGRFIARR